MATVEEVLQAALTLGEEDRELVAELIWGSVHADAPLRFSDEERAAVTEELRQAEAEFKSGADKGEPWPEIRDRMLRDMGLDV